MHNGVVHARSEGTPQGGPLSPLLANVLLDEVDQELERRGHRFARYADDCNVYVCSRQARQRVMALLERLYTKLHLKINESKSAVGSAFGRKFLDYSLWAAPKGEIKCKVAKTPQVWRQLDEWMRHRLRAIQLKAWKRSKTIYRELLAMVAGANVARTVAANSRRWWRNRRYALNNVMTIAYFDSLGMPRLA